MNKTQACGSSAGKDSPCNAGDPTFNSWVRKIYCRKDKLPTPVFLFWASLVGRIHLQCRRPRGFDPWVGKISWRRENLPIQYSWVSLVAQMVKSPHAMPENWIRSLGQADPLEEGMATHSSIPGESHGQKSLEGYSP